MIDASVLPGRLGVGSLTRIVVCLFAVWAATELNPARSQEPVSEEDPLTEADAVNPNDEAAARRMIEDVQFLIDSQRREVARQLIQRYPNTQLARYAQELLDEYARYDQLKVREKERDAAESLWLREYWKTHLPPVPVAMHYPLTITNESGQPVVYQVRWRGMKWMGPYVLSAGKTHTFHNSLIYRRITREGVREHTLLEGGRYVFRNPQDGGLPQLFEPGPERLPLAVAP